MNPQDEAILKLYFELIKANTGDLFKAYYFGDPPRVPVSRLPAIIGTITDSATEAGDQNNLGGNSEDVHSVTVVLNVVSDIRKTFSDDTEKVPGFNSLYDLMQGRDPNTYLLKPTSLLYIIRHNTALANNIWSDAKGQTRIKYGLRQGRQPDSWSMEAVLTTVCTLVQLR